jgi:hypothetical protein
MYFSHLFVFIFLICFVFVQMREINAYIKQANVFGKIGEYQEWEIHHVLDAGVGSGHLVSSNVQRRQVHGFYGGTHGQHSTGRV